MFTTQKNTAFTQYTFGRLAKPQIYDLALYPFGSIMVSVSKGEYRYGMNTQEKDNEIYGEGNSYSAEYWQYDARLGRRWNVDPKDVPSFSPYSCFANNPLWFSDVAGDSAVGTTATTQSKVQSGEGPYQFAKRNNISPEQLIKYNKDVFPEGYKKGTWLINPGQKLNTTDPNQPSSSFTPTSLGKFSTTLNTPKSAFGDHSRISFSSKTKGETNYEGSGDINWNMVGNGAMTITGGALATVGGVAASYTGVGTPMGVSLAISTGIPAMGLGAGMMVNGFRGGNKELPGGVVETLDRGMGGAGTVGQIFDIGLGGLPKTLLETTMMGYGLYNSNLGQMMMTPPVGCNYIPQIAPADNTRVVLPHITRQ